MGEIHSSLGERETLCKHPICGFYYAKWLGRRREAFADVSARLRISQFRDPMLGIRAERAQRVPLIRRNLPSGARLKLRLEEYLALPPTRYILLRCARSSRSAFTLARLRHTPVRLKKPYTRCSSATIRSE